MSIKDLIEDFQRHVDEMEADMQYQQPTPPYLAGKFVAYSRVLKALREVDNDVLEKIKEEIMEEGAYHQEVDSRTDYVKGINFCIDVINRYLEEEK